MLYLYPKLVKSDKIKKHQLSPDAKSKNVISYEKTIKRAWNTTDLSKSGIIGDPTKASALKGKKILEVTSNTLKKIITEMK
jgi:creatinine amidohydrolase